MTPFLMCLFVLALGASFVWYNEWQASKEAVEPNAADRILRDASINYLDGSSFRFYEAKPTVKNMTFKSYAVHPDVRASNIEEIQAILKFKEHVAEHGIEISLEQAAEIWAEKWAKGWREQYELENEIVC
jgi:hypothetical protein